MPFSRQEILAVLEEIDAQCESCARRGCGHGACFHTHYREATCCAAPGCLCPAYRARFRRQPAWLLVARARLWRLLHRL